MTGGFIFPGDDDDDDRDAGVTDGRDVSVTVDDDLPDAPEQPDVPHKPGAGLQWQTTNGDDLDVSSVGVIAYDKDKPSAWWIHVAETDMMEVER